MDPFRARIHIVLQDEVLTKKLKKFSLKAKKKQRMWIFLEVCWMELDQGKIFKVKLCSRKNSWSVPQFSKIILETMCHNNKTVLDGATKNPSYGIGIVSIWKSWYRPSLLYSHQKKTIQFVVLIRRTNQIFSPTVYCVIWDYNQNFCQVLKYNLVPRLFTYARRFEKEAPGVGKEPGYEVDSSNALDSNDKYYF